MNNFFLYLALFFCSCGATTPSDPSPVKDFEAFQLNYQGHSFDIIRLDTSYANLRFFLSNEKGDNYRSLNKLKSAVEKKGQSLSFAMNGGMYQKDGSPQGLYIESGNLIQSMDTIQQANGNFYLQPNGVFYLKNNKGHVRSSLEYIKTNPAPDFATQSGPMLVIDDEIHPVFTKGSKHLNIRNGVGIDAHGRIVLAISNEELSLYDFAMLFKEGLDCKNALYLDGFVSKAYIPDFGRKELGGNFGVIISGVRN